MDLSTINFSGDKMPILCTISVLEKIQEEFGNITNFSEKLVPVGKKKTENWMPDIHAIAYALPLFIDEGIAAYNETHNIKIEKVEPEKLFRKLDQPILSVSLALYKELWRSVNAPKQQPHDEMNQI